MVVDTAAERMGRLDVVVNNAGGSPILDSATASPRISTRIIELNLLAPLHISQRANAIMQAQDDGGSIIMISSVSGVRPSPGTAVYGAAKAGLNHLVRTPRAGMGAQGAGQHPRRRARRHRAGRETTTAARPGSLGVAATVPMKRMVTPADVAGACLFLGSDLASAVTGADMAVHGGGEHPEFLAVVDAAHRTSSNERDGAS